MIIERRQILVNWKSKSDWVDAKSQRLDEEKALNLCRASGFQVGISTSRPEENYYLVFWGISGGHPDKLGQDKTQLSIPISIHARYIFLRPLNRKMSSFLKCNAELLHNCWFEEKNRILLAEKVITLPLGETLILIHFSWEGEGILA